MVSKYSDIVSENSCYYISVKRKKRTNQKSISDRAIHKTSNIRDTQTIKELMMINSNDESFNYKESRLIKL